MAVESQETVRIRGLVPNIDRRRMKEPFVVAGANFIVDVDGPVSALGTHWLFNEQIAEPRGFQTFPSFHQTATLLCLGNCIAEYDAETRQLYILYRHTLRTKFWPWSYGFVGNVIYLANYEVGLLAYDFQAGTFKQVTGANIPSTVYACCESAGRLVVIGPDNAHWSAIDDGSNDGFAPSTSTGAGFQTLSRIASKPDPYMVLPYAAGFLTYTRRGIMRSEFTNTANPFRHDVLSRDHIVVNPWCVIRVGETDYEHHIMLTRRGLFQTRGDTKPEAWQPLWGEYFHRNVLPQLTLICGCATANDNFPVRLDHDFDTGWVVVSVAEDDRNAVFNRAYIHYLPSEEWGEFTGLHTGFGKLYVDFGPSAGPKYGVCDNVGSFHLFDYGDSNRVYPENDVEFFLDLKENYDVPAQYDDINNTIIFQTLLQFYTEDISGASKAGTYDLQYQLLRAVSPAVEPTYTESEEAASESGGVYNFRTGFPFMTALRRITTGPILNAVRALNSHITVGPYMVTTERSVDIISQWHDGIIGMLDTGIGDTFEDYIADYGVDDLIFDWNTDAFDNEDWGESQGSLTEYSVEIFGSIDGYSVWNVNGQEQKIVPDLVAQSGRARYLSGLVSGKYIYTRITAEELGEIFHLKVLEHNLLNAGQLY